MSKSLLPYFIRALAITAVCGVVMISASRAEMKAQPVLAELFTSQGCSSCPEADQIWAELQQRNDVIALSFSIDYWDYIGWKDTLAKRENTLRQQAYAKAMPSRQVYTPQVIIDGLKDVVGNERQKLFSAIDARVAKSRGKRTEVSLSKSGSIVHIRIGTGETTRPATVWIAHTTGSKTVKIKSGENGGRVMTYTNVVRDFASAGTWSGQALALQVPAYGTDKSEVTDGIAVWVQLGSHDQVLGAAQLRYSSPK